MKNDFKPQCVIVKKQYIISVRNAVRRVVYISNVYNAIYTQIPISTSNKNTDDHARAM